VRNRRRIRHKGGFRCRGGGLISPGGGFVAVPIAEAGGITLDTLSPADIAALTGFAEPTWMVRGGDAAGALDLVGSDDLTDSGTPTKENADTALAGTTTVMDDNTTDAMDAAANTVLDVASETITVMWIGKFAAANSAIRHVCGKRASAGGNYGWELQSAASGSNNQFQWIADSPSGIDIEAVAVDHGTTNAQVVVCTRSWANNLVGIWTREGTSSGARIQDSMTNTATFAMGQQRITAAPCSHGALAVWIGTDGDWSATAADFETARLAVATALGYEP